MRDDHSDLMQWRHEAAYPMLEHAAKSTGHRGPAGCQSARLVCSTVLMVPARGEAIRGEGSMAKRGSSVSRILSADKMVRSKTHNLLGVQVFRAVAART